MNQLLEKIIYLCCMPLIWSQSVLTLEGTVSGSSGLVWILVDKTTDLCSWYITNFVVGKLHPDEPGKPHLPGCKVLEKINHSSIARFVNDPLQLLWPSKIENNCCKVLVLLTDGASYMLKAAKALQVFYPNLIHVTCLAHGLHRIAEKSAHSFQLLTI